MEAVNKHFKTKFESPIVAVVTKKPYTDKEGKEVFSEVDHWAHKRNIPKFYSAQEWLDSGIKADLGILASYGAIIPDLAIKGLKLGILNLHPSLLPKYRGALCVSEAIKNQDQVTGVTLMQMDKDLDHGPIITQKKLSININDNVATLTQKLTLLAISFSDTLHRLVRGPSKPQNHNKATYTPSTKSRTRQSAFIKTLTTKNPKKIHALIRSLNPDPGAWTIINGQEIKILETKLKYGQLEIITVQLPGKTPISWQRFINRYQLSK